MHLYRHISHFKGSDRGVAIAIGNFDGFHKGHQAVISKMMEKAQAMNLESAVMIFEPQPLEFFGRAIPPRLFTLRDKVKAFKKAGVEIVFCIPFRRAFSELDAHEFVHDILCRMLYVKSITVGSLFSFGRGGVYTFKDLKEEADAEGIEASCITAIAADDVRVSSTIVRTLIENGDFKTAYDLSGHEYIISGKVVHGNELGRAIGFPTANVNLYRKVCALKGVYAVWAHTSYGTFKGVANVGVRPTVSDDNVKSLLEVHIVEFDNDLYGQEIEVEFVAKLREERKFESLDKLVEQIGRDKARAVELLSEIKK